MKYSLFNQNVGMFLYISTVLAASHSSLEDRISVYDLCTVYNGVIRIRVGSDFQFAIQSAPVLQTAVNGSCTLQFKACPSCHLEIIIKHMNIPSCLPDKCGCNFFEVEESWSKYNEKFCGRPIRDHYFESKTKSITIKFSYDKCEEFSVTINVAAKRNAYVITGMPDADENYAGYIESPFFPLNYPSDYTAHFVLHSSGCVELTFMDFLLSNESFIEVEGHNENRVDTFSGKEFRPPAIMSKYQMLHIKFSANYQSRSGFRARYIYPKNCDENMKTYTDCGSSVHSSGGVLLLNVVGVSDRLFDCIWLIHTPTFAPKPFSATIIEFKNTGEGSFVEFRNGLTSKSMLVMEFKCKGLNCNVAGSEVAVPGTPNLYVRMVGYLAKGSSIIISYAFFSESDCASGEFKCHNGRCISKSLYCDGYNHCMDNSDEICKDDTTVPQTFRQITYAAPQGLSSDEPHPVAMQIFITLFVIAVISITVIIVRWFYKNRPSFPRQRTQPLQVTSENIEQFPCPASSVPSFLDRPPSYQEVMRFPQRYPPVPLGIQDSSGIQDSTFDFQEITVPDTSTSSSSNHIHNTVNVGFHINCVDAACSSLLSSSVSVADEIVCTPRRNQHSILPAGKDQDHFNHRSLDSIWRANPPGYHLCHSVNITESPNLLSPVHCVKISRCVTLPSDYKLSETKCDIKNRRHYSENSSDSASSEPSDLPRTLRTNTVNDSQHNYDICDKSA